MSFVRGFLQPERIDYMDMLEEQSSHHNNESNRRSLVTVIERVLILTY